MPLLTDDQFFGAPSPPAPAAAPASGAVPSSRLLSDAEFFGGGGSGAGGRLLSDDEFFSGAPAPRIRFDQTAPVPSAADNEDLAARNDAARASMPPLSGLLGLEGNPPAETPAQNAQGQAEAEQVAQQGTADSGAGSLGRALASGGRELRDVAASYVSDLANIGNPQPEETQRQLEVAPEQIAAQRAGTPRAPTPLEQGQALLPTGERIFSKAGTGLIESAPQFGAMLGLDALGVPAPVAAAVAFGSTEHGFDPQSAAVAAAIPYVGKYTGDIVSSLAGKLGVSSERALQIFHGAGGAAGATAYLGTIQASEIANLPPEQRRAATIDAIANNLAMLPLSFMGGEGPKSEQEATEETEVNKNEPEHTQVKTEPLNQNVANGENVNQPSAPISAESLAELQAAMTANQVTPPRLMGRELAESLRAGPTEAESGAPNQTPAPESQAEPSAESTTIVPPGETPGGGAGPGASQRGSGEPGSSAGPSESTSGEPKQPSAVANWLDRAVAATDPLKGELREGVLGAPVWLTQSAAHGALKAVRLAWRAGKAIHEAIEDGVNWLRLNAPKAFDEDQARDWLASSVEAARQALAKKASAGTMASARESYSDVSGKLNDVSIRTGPKPGESEWSMNPGGDSVKDLKAPANLVFRPEVLKQVPGARKGVMRYIGPARDLLTSPTLEEHFPEIAGQNIFASIDPKRQVNRTFGAGRAHLSGIEYAAETPEELMVGIVHELTHRVQQQLGMYPPSEPVPNDANTADYWLDPREVQARAAENAATRGEDPFAWAAPKSTKADPVGGFLDRAIAATDPLKGELREGVLGAPVWLTQSAAHGALKAVRLAWRAGKAIHEAIEAGVDWLRLNAPKAFHEDQARDWLASSVEAARQAGAKGYGEAIEKLAGPEEAGGGQAGLPLQGRAQIDARREEINTRLNEINATRRGPGVGLPDELRSERYQLIKEDRALLRQLSSDPGYVADLLKRIDGLGNDLQRARAAGYGAQAIHLGNEMDGLMNGELSLVPDELRQRIYADLVARGEIGASQLGPVPAGRTLNGLTAWLNANKLDSPKLSLMDRLNLSQKLADEWNAGKDKLGGLVNKLSASWQAFKTNYRQGAPVDTEFRKLVKSWLYEKQWTGIETANWLRSLRLSVTAPLRRQAMSVWLDAGGDPRLLESQRDLVPPRFRPVWDTALKLTDGEKNLARQVQSDFRGKLEDAQNVGLLDKGREDYGVPQIWKTPPKNEGGWEPGDAGGPGRAPRNPVAKLDPRDPFFALKRSNPSYFDGIMQGGVPKSLDLGDLVAVYNAQFHDALADRGLIKNLKDAKGPDGQPIVAIGGGTRVEAGAKPGERTFFVDSKWNGDTPVAADGRPYRAVDHWALRGWKFAARDADGNPILVRGDFLVHPDYFSFLKNELGKSWFRDPDGGGKYFNPLFESAAFLKASKFASATFHMATLAEHSMFHAFAGQPSAERLGLLWPSIKGVQLDPLRNPELAGLMRHGMELGFGGGREFFEEGLASHGGIWSHVPGLGQAMGRLTDFLFQDYMPRLKAKTAAVMLHSNQERYQGKLSPDQIMELTAHQANAAFGAQNWRLLGTNKTLLDANRLLLTAPDFLLSRAKVVAQALKPYNAEQRYFLLAQAALVYTAARVLNQLLDGNPHWEAANALRVVYKGRSYGARFLVSDVANMVQDPATFWQGRLGPLPRTAIEASTGRDMRTGARIDVPFNVPALRSAEIAVKDLAEWLVPIGAEGLLPGAAGREQTKLGQAALALGGVGSRKYTAETQMWDAAAKFNRSSPDAKSVLYQKTRDNEAGQTSAYRKLDDLLDAGQLDRARTEFDALEKEGKDGASIFRRYAAVQRPFTGSLARELAFRNSLSPADNAVYQKAIGERMAREAAFVKMLNQGSANLHQNSATSRGASLAP